MPPFKEWKYKDASGAVTNAIKASVGESGFKANSAFVEDRDHWQNGDTWVGPDGGPNSPVRAQILQAVSRQFIPVDVIGEVLDNVANALLNREADVSFTPIEQLAEPEIESEATKTTADKLAKEAEAMRSLVSHWWDKRKLWELARKATKRARWSGRGALRNWIAPSTLQSANVAEQRAGVARLPTNLEFADALDKVLLSAPKPDACYIVTDPQTNERAGVYLFKRDEKSFAEIWYIDGEDTVVRVLEENKEAATTYPLKLGKRLPISEMEADVLITEPVRRQQNRANFFESLLVRVGETAGFPERYTMNAKPQGVWLKTAPQNGPALETFSDGSITWYLHAAPRTLGAAITTDLRGVETTDAQGSKTVASPGVTKFEPTDPEYAIKAGKYARATILHGCKQGHLISDSTAESSGLAYEQARAGFEADLNNTKSPLEGMLRDTIECAIALAELMSGTSPEQSFLKKFRCVVNLHVNAGPVTPDQKRANAEMVDKKLLARDSAMAANGVEDVDAEVSAIDETPEGRRARAKSIADAMKALVEVGATKEAAAEFLGLTPEEAKLFTQRPFTEPPLPQ